jgi:hypothetical protein
MALPQNQYLQSRNGVYYCVMRQDGNLVVYISRHAVPSNIIWSTNLKVEQGEGGPYCLSLKDNGELVLLDVSCVVLWKASLSSPAASKSFQPEYWLTMEDDGNLVLRDGKSEIMWSSDSSRGDPTLLLPLLK